MTEQEFYERYGHYPRINNRPKKKKIYYNRIIIALLVLILIIFGIVQLVKTIAGHFNKDDVPAVVEKSDSRVDDENDAETLTSQLQFKVCIDAGHGDYDGGTTNLDGTRIEKDDNLKVALLVEKYLNEMGATVIMVRADDTFYDLQERCSIANDTKSDLFVSLHRNSYEGDENGVEIWVHNQEPIEDTTLATNILKDLEKVGIAKARGVKFGYPGVPTDNYHVNAETKMPSCLVELGFLTDATDNQLFDEKVDEYAKAIATGIVQTAKDLKVIDDDGKRILNEQLISADKVYVADSYDVSDEDENSDVNNSDYSGEDLYNQGESQAMVSNYSNLD